MSKERPLSKSTVSLVKPGRYLARGSHRDSIGAIEKSGRRFTAWRYGNAIGEFRNLLRAVQALERADRIEPIR